MKTVIAQLKSVSAYSQSRHYDVPRLDKESNDDYEKRTWRERCHVNVDGFIVIPSMAAKNMLSETAKYLSLQIRGKGKQTYTKNFEAGVLVMDPLVLPITKDAVLEERLFVPSNGRRGSGSRVWKSFPIIHDWAGAFTFYILDETITETIFEHHLREGGKFIGLGRFRPRNNGCYGRFTVEDIVWG
jgi:hypothetical protein